MALSSSRLMWQREQKRATHDGRLQPWRLPAALAAVGRRHRRRRRRASSLATTAAPFRLIIPITTHTHIAPCCMRAYTRLADYIHPRISFYTHTPAGAHSIGQTREREQPPQKCSSEFLYSSVSFPFSSISVVGAVLFPIPALHQNDKVPALAEVHTKPTLFRLFSFMPLVVPQENKQWKAIFLGSKKSYRHA